MLLSVEHIFSECYFPIVVKLFMNVYYCFFSVALKVLTEKCMLHMKEGLCMTYTNTRVLLVFGEEPVKVWIKRRKQQINLFLKIKLYDIY